MGRNNSNMESGGYRAPSHAPIVNFTSNHMSISNSYGRAAEAPIFRAPTEPRQRGRPRKSVASVIAKGKEESVALQVAKVLVRALKDRSRPFLSDNHGFNRNQKPDFIVSGFFYEEQFVFAVRFKGRKTPDFISARELKLRAPDMLINFYESHLHYPNYD